MSERKQLYAYTTPIYKEKGLVKIGDSKVGRYKERIREQFNASNPELPEILFVDTLPEGKRDHHIHKQLEKNGIEKKEVSAGSEWYYASLEDIKLAFNQVKYGISRLESFSLRKEQSAAVHKAKEWFLGNHPAEVIDSATHSNRFLLNAKMRFGKCFTGVHIAKEVKASNTLIVTYKPQVISEWIEAVNNHIDFDGWTGIRAKEKDRNGVDPILSSNGDFPETNGPIVLCASLQDLAIDENGETKERLKNVVSKKWDLIIFDEVHFGSRTDRARYIIDQLNWTYRLDLSGTPFRLIQEDDFCSQQVFTYSYLDEQANKRAEIEDDLENKKEKIYRVMPDLNISTIEITDDDINEQREKFLTDDLDFSLNELFKVSKGDFIHEDAVDHFIDGLCKRDHDARAVSIFGKLGDKFGVPATRHSVWWLSRVDSIKCLIKKLKNHPYFSQFEYINAAGCDKNNADVEVEIAKDKESIMKKINKVSKDPSKIGTITLTCRRFLTGVTIKEWDSILVLNDVKSAEAYYQAIFRVQSAWTDKVTKDVIKPKAWVFDFAISRCLRITYEYADALADQLDQQDTYEQQVSIYNDNLTSVISGLCDDLDIKRFYEGKLESNKVTERDIFEALNLKGSRVSLAKKITSDALVNFISLKYLEQYPHLFEVLKNVKGYRTQEVGTVEDMVKIGRDADELDKKKKSQGKDDDDDDEREKSNEEFQENEKDKEKKTRKKWYATQIKRLAICMSDFIYMTKFREHKIDHVIETRDSEFFQVVTGISKEDFKELCDMGFISRTNLNKIVRQFRYQEDSSLKPEEFIFDHLSEITKDAA